MDCYYLRSMLPVKMLTLLLAIISSSCLAATQSSVSVDHSLIKALIAFVCGASFVVFFIGTFLRSITSFKWQFPVLISSAFAVMLISLTYFTDYQVLVLLSSSAIFIVSSNTWLLYLNALSSSEINSPKLVQSLIITSVVSAILYIIALWLVPSIDAYITWGIYCSIILIGSLISLIRKFTVRFFIQWLSMLILSSCLYFWLNADIPLSVLLLSALLMFLISTINGSYYSLATLRDKVSLQSLSEQKIDKHVISYPYDPATNLPSSHQAFEQFEKALKQNPELRCAAIVFKPINFQQVNTVLGHHNSDILLLQLAYCLQQKVALNNDLINFNINEPAVRIARLQGLQFLVILNLSASEHPDEIMIENLCKQLVEAIPEAMSFKSFSLNFELTFGAAIVGQHGNTTAEVIAHAEDALLYAEKNQLNISYFNHQLTLYCEKQLLQMKRLQQDVDEHKLHYYLQPQIRIDNKSIVGFELKVHWYNGEEQPLSLNQFLNLAEQSGEIYQLGKQMINTAFEAIVKLKEQNFNHAVSIQLASKDLLEPDLVHYIEEQIKHYDISGASLLIELREKVMLLASGKAKYIIDQLRSLGVGIVISDFSGSYEALRYLRKMSIDQIKIDCSLLADGQDKTEKAIVNALINLSRSMKLPFIGTGINNQAIEKSFVSIGGQIAQGNVFNQGVVLEELEVWLKNWLELYSNQS